MVSLRIVRAPKRKVVLSQWRVDEILKIIAENYSFYWADVPSSDVSLEKLLIWIGQIYRYVITSGIKSGQYDL